MMQQFNVLLRWVHTRIAQRLIRLIALILVLFSCLLFCCISQSHAFYFEPAGYIPQQYTTSQSSKVYYGVHVANLTASDFSNVTAFENDAQKQVSIILWFQAWGATNNQFNSALMTAIRTHGSIPHVTWEPWVPGKGPNQPLYSLNNIISGNFDAYITQWALAAKAWGYPFYLRFAHEMNGYWYPWGVHVNGNTPGQYVAAWKHVHDIFTQLGVTNVTWVWAPAAWNGEGTLMRQVYPGDSYVDWAGMSGYNWGGKTWSTFTAVFGHSYNYILAITSKPMMITETASNEIGGDKAAWITDAYSVQIPTNFSQVKAITWFNVNKKSGGGPDWRIESSASAQSAFATAIQNPIYASNEFANITTSPIAPL